MSTTLNLFRKYSVLLTHNLIKAIITAAKTRINLNYYIRLVLPVVLFKLILPASFLKGRCTKLTTGKKKQPSITFVLSNRISETFIGNEMNYSLVIENEELFFL